MVAERLGLAFLQILVAALSSLDATMAAYSLAPQLMAEVVKFEDKPSLRKKQRGYVAANYLQDAA